eukprot:TRINITY_DN10682_c0_g2_i1.p2 TRINITY_DN10682_c0_g2~~TRINITY_DN10682_c0_g2_i1.p2  ORF type:complete len:113 (+),score=18.10 TRINITY_DN10682_c0_g2_i1:298-636(+)
MCRSAAAFRHTARRGARGCARGASLHWGYGAGRVGVGTGMRAGTRTRPCMLSAAAASLKALQRCRALARGAQGGRGAREGVHAERCCAIGRQVDALGGGVGIAPLPLRSGMQ